MSMIAYLHQASRTQEFFQRLAADRIIQAPMDDSLMETKNVWVT